MKKNQIWMISLFLGMVAVDQGTKHWVRTAGDMTPGHTVKSVIPGFFDIHLVFNDGIAFGLLEKNGALLAPVAILMAGGALYLGWKRPGHPLRSAITYGLLAAGAIGNLIDRMWMQQVTDFLYFHYGAFRFPVFNVADVCITGAAALLIYTALTEKKKAQPEETFEAPPLIEP